MTTFETPPHSNNNINDGRDDDVLEIRKALASAQADGRLAAQLGQQLIQQKQEFQEKTRQETLLLVEELKSLRESWKDAQAQMKVDREKTAILSETVQKLEEQLEEKTSELEHMKIKIQSVDLERRKALDDQDRLVADLDAAEEEMLRLRRMELSLRQERDKLQDKLDEIKMNVGKHDDDVHVLLEEVEELRPLKQIVHRKDIEIQQLQEALKEEQARSDDTIAEATKEKGRLQQIIEELRGSLAELKAKSSASSTAIAEKSTLAINRGFMQSNPWGEVSSGTKDTWGVNANNNHHSNGISSSSNSSSNNHHQNNGLNNHGLGDMNHDEHQSDNCPCGAEHIKHVLAHTKRPQLKVCDICSKHFCRRCAAYQIYGRDYRHIDAKTVTDCYMCWIQNGGTLEKATAALSRAAEDRNRRGGVGGGLWPEDSINSFYSDAGSEHSHSSTARNLQHQIMAKMRGFISG